MKQDELDGDPRFTTTIGFKSKSLNHLMTNIKQY